MSDDLRVRHLKASLEQRRLQAEYWKDHCGHLKASLEQRRLQAEYWKDHCGYLTELVRAWTNRARAAEKFPASHYKEATNKAQAEVDGHVI